MAEVRFREQRYQLRDRETVLEALLREGIAIPNSCRAGICQSCLVKAVGGERPPTAAQAGLSAQLAQTGHALACRWTPSADVEVALPDDASVVRGVIRAADDLSATVKRIRVEALDGFDFYAGQYAVVMREDGLARSYSIASLPTDGFVELHVRRIVGGAMSNWLHDEAAPGETVSLRGPAGQCFYMPGNPGQPLLLCGTGTGLAPLIGVLRTALTHGHTGPIWLFHGAVAPPGLYLQQELEALAHLHPNVRYQPVVLQDPEQGMLQGGLDDVVLRELGSPKSWRSYVCGDPTLVNKIRKRLFLAGAASREIFADAFVMGGPAAN